MRRDQRVERHNIRSDPTLPHHLSHDSHHLCRPSGSRIRSHRAVVAREGGRRLGCGGSVAREHRLLHLRCHHTTQPTLSLALPTGGDERGDDEGVGFKRER